MAVTWIPNSIINTTESSNTWFTSNSEIHVPIVINVWVLYRDMYLEMNKLQTKKNILLLIPEWKILLTSALFKEVLYYLSQ